MPIVLPAAIGYGGLEVLAIAPEMIDGASRRDRLALGAERLATPWTDGGAVRATGAAPRGAHVLTWACPTRAHVARLDAFLARCRGALTAFWLPSYRQDFTVLATATNTWTVAGWGYAARVAPMFAALGVSDHVIGVLPDERWFVRRVTAAAANPDGTETLTFAAGVPATSAVAVVGADLLRRTEDGLAAGLLRCARLADEPVLTEFHRGDVALVRAGAVELLRETPL